MKTRFGVARCCCPPPPEPGEPGGCQPCELTDDFDTLNVDKWFFVPGGPGIDGHPTQGWHLADGALAPPTQFGFLGTTSGNPEASAGAVPVGGALARAKFSVEILLPDTNAVNFSMNAGVDAIGDLPFPSILINNEFQPQGTAILQVKSGFVTLHSQPILIATFGRYLLEMEATATAPDADVFDYVVRWNNQQIYADQASVLAASSDCRTVVLHGLSLSGFPAAPIDYPRWDNVSLELLPCGDLLDCQATTEIPQFVDVTFTGVGNGLCAECLDWNDTWTLHRVPNSVPARWTLNVAVQQNFIPPCFAQYDPEINLQVDTVWVVGPTKKGEVSSLVPRARWSLSIDPYPGSPAAPPGGRVVWNGEPILSFPCCREEAIVIPDSIQGEAFGCVWGNAAAFISPQCFEDTIIGGAASDITLLTQQIDFTVFTPAFNIVNLSQTLQPASFMADVANAVVKFLNIVQQLQGADFDADVTMAQVVAKTLDIDQTLQGALFTAAVAKDVKFLDILQTLQPASLMASVTRIPFILRILDILQTLQPATIEANVAKEVKLLDILQVLQAVDFDADITVKKTLDILQALQESLFTADVTKLGPPNFLNIDQTLQAADFDADATKFQLRTLDIDQTLKPANFHAVVAVNCPDGVDCVHVIPFQTPEYIFLGNIQGTFSNPQHPNPCNDDYNGVTRFLRQSASIPGGAGQPCFWESDPDEPNPYNCDPDDVYLHLRVRNQPAPGGGFESRMIMELGFTGGIATLFYRWDADLGPYTGDGNFNLRGAFPIIFNPSNLGFVGPLSNIDMASAVITIVADCPDPIAPFRQADVMQQALLVTQSLMLSVQPPNNLNIDQTLALVGTSGEVTLQAKLLDILQVLAGVEQTATATDFRLRQLDIVQTLALAGMSGSATVFRMLNIAQLLRSAGLAADVTKQVNRTLDIDQTLQLAGTSADVAEKKTLLISQSLQLAGTSGDAMKTSVRTLNISQTLQNVSTSGSATRVQRCPFCQVVMAETMEVSISGVVQGAFGQCPQWNEANTNFLLDFTIPLLGTSVCQWTDDTITTACAPEFDFKVQLVPAAGGWKFEAIWQIVQLYTDPVGGGTLLSFWQWQKILATGAGPPTTVPCLNYFPITLNSANLTYSPAAEEPLDWGNATFIFDPV